MKFLILNITLSLFSLACSDNLEVGLTDTPQTKLNTSSDAQGKLDDGIEREDVTIEDPDNDETITPVGDGGGTNIPNEDNQIRQEIASANAIYGDKTNPEYTKFANKIANFDQSLNSCMEENSLFFNSHIKSTPECEDHLESLEKHKQRVINRCLKYNFLPNISQNAKERLSRVYPRSKERINRRYRIAQLEGCILGDIPDQSQVDYTFNSSIEASDINGRWDIKDSASIAGWKVRFYDKDKQSIDKTGFLELQANELFRTEMASSSNTHYVELDSHCPSGQTCSTTNVSMKQKIIIDNKHNFNLYFNARKRTNASDDSIMEILFYKKGTKVADRDPLANFNIIRDNSLVPVDPSKSIPTSTQWERYKAELGEIDPGVYFIEINEIGKSNTLGSLIDNISIRQN